METENALNWIKTSEYQWVRMVDENLFYVIDVTVLGLEQEKYYVKPITVDLWLMEDKEIETRIQGYYKSLNNVKEIFGKKWKRIVAECIADNEPIDPSHSYFDTLEELTEHLLNVYKIQL